jgi:hypothetical protein
LWKSAESPIFSGSALDCALAEHEVLCLPLSTMTQEEIQEIRSRWLPVKFRHSFDATATDPGLVAAAADIWRLLSEIGRLQHSCDEITRQYARLLRQAENLGIAVQSESAAGR